MLIKHVAFDCFGVLIDVDGHFFDAVCEQLNVASNDHMSSYTANIHLFQRGQIDETLLWKRVFGTHVEEPLWSRAYSRRAQPNEEMIRLLDQARAQHSVGILSNIETPLVPMVERSLELSDDIFRYYSCEKGKRKPDRAIFTDYANQVGLTPSEISFIDDSEENVWAAREAGFYAILHADIEATRSIIESL